MMLLRMLQTCGISVNDVGTHGLCVLHYEVMQHPRYIISCKYSENIWHSICHPHPVTDMTFQIINIPAVVRYAR